MTKPVTSQTVVIWIAPTSGRRYLTKRAAIAAEARSLILARYPTEPKEFGVRGIAYEGWSWRELPRSDVLYRRVQRMVRAATIMEARK